MESREADEKKCYHKSKFQDNSHKKIRERLENITRSTSEVLVYHGATEFVLILSFAHSQARFLVS